MSATVGDGLGNGVGAGVGNETPGPSNNGLTKVLWEDAAAHNGEEAGSQDGSFATSTECEEHVFNMAVAKEPSVRPTAPAIDTEEMKKKARSAAFRHVYDVTEHYKTHGCAQKIARSSLFEYATLAVIGANALWIWIDTDYNDAEVVFKAHWVFQVGDHFFCSFFFAEWLIRFLAFAKKRQCLLDSWFVFDSALVSMMVFETWIMTIFLVLTSSESTGSFNPTSLRLLRLMRLTRVSRLVRFLRGMPELLFMIKGMLAATRSVFFTMLLLLFILYVFAITLRQLLKGGEPNDPEYQNTHAVRDEYFPEVLTSVYNLIIYGTLLDNVGNLMDALVEANTFAAFCFGVVILLAALTMMNMLVGVLCEVVSATAKAETEEMNVTYVKNKVKGIFEQEDKDYSCAISQREFKMMLDNPDAVAALHDVGVDVEALVDYSTVYFQNDSRGEKFDKEMPFDDFMERVLQLRKDNTASVKDISELRQFIHMQNAERNLEFKKMEDRLSRVEQLQERMTGKLDLLSSAVSAVSDVSRAHRHVSGMDANHTVVDVPVGSRRKTVMVCSKQPRADTGSSTMVSTSSPPFGGNSFPGPCGTDGGHNTGSGSSAEVKHAW